MSTLVRRIAATLIALPLAATTGTLTAAADTTVPGCYGVGVVVCDPTVEYGLPAGVETYQTELPVCAGSCTYVPITLVRTGPGEPLHLCVSYRNLSGGVTRECGGVPDITWLTDTVRGVVDQVPSTAEILEAVRGVLEWIDLSAVRELLEQDLGAIVEAVARVVCRTLAATTDGVTCASD